MKKITLIALVAVSLLSFRLPDTSVWTVDKSHAKLGFTITHLMVSDIEGSFKSFDAKVNASKDDFSDATVELTADVNSVNTDDDKRDAHIKGPDFFDAAKYPSLTFKSTSFKKIAENKYKVTGDLTLHGVTKPVVLDAVARTGTNPMSKKTITGFKISGSLKRTDYGVGTQFPGAMLSDEVIITANAEFVKN
jgi:polyisoprenoid-binding protein YceI